MRYNRVLVFIFGQSQAIMAGTGGGETVDTPLVGENTAGQELNACLQAWMPSLVDSQVLTQAFFTGGTAYTAVGGTPLLRSYNNGGTAFWNDTNGTFDTHGNAQVNYVLARANANALCVVIHWNQTQDTNFTGWSDQGYATALNAYYAALNTALASSFGEFRILPMCPGHRPGDDTTAARLGVMRQIMDCMGGVHPPLLGITQQPYFLKPCYGWPYVSRGTYIAGDPDFIHVIRSASWRMARACAARITAHNGVTPPPYAAPRISHAKMIGANTLRIWIVSPAGYPIVRQWLSGVAQFRITGGGSVTSQVGTIDNSEVATTGFATLDLPVAGVVRTSRLTFNSGDRGYSEFVNGPTPPRGQLENAVYADPGSTPEITDAAEDCVGSEYPLFVEQNERGVSIDTE